MCVSICCDWERNSLIRQRRHRLGAHSPRGTTHNCNSVIVDVRFVVQLLLCDLMSAQEYSRIEVAAALRGRRVVEFVPSSVCSL